MRATKTQRDNEREGDGERVRGKERGRENSIGRIF